MLLRSLDAESYERRLNNQFKSEGVVEEVERRCLNWLRSFGMMKFFVKLVDFLVILFCLMKIIDIFVT